MNNSQLPNKQFRLSKCNRNRPILQPHAGLCDMISRSVAVRKEFFICTKMLSTAPINITLGVMPVAGFIFEKIILQKKSSHNSARLLQFLALPLRTVKGIGSVIIHAKNQINRKSARRRRKEILNCVEVHFVKHWILHKILTLQQISNTTLIGLQSHPDNETIVLVLLLTYSKTTKPLFTSNPHYFPSLA